MCDKNYGHKSDLTKHKLARHEGVSYACNQCDYKVIRQTTLANHKHDNNEGVRYRWEDYKATMKGGEQV